MPRGQRTSIIAKLSGMCVNQKVTGVHYASRLTFRRPKACVRMPGLPKRTGRSGTKPVIQHFRGSMLSFTFFLIAVFGLLLSKKLFNDFFTPPAIYTFFWAFALGMLDLNWVDFNPLRANVWSAILISYGAFMAGTLTLSIYALGKTKLMVNQPLFHYVDRERFEKTLWVLFGLGIFGFIVQLVHLQLEFGLATFITDPMSARAFHSNVRYLGFFNILNLANFVFAFLYLQLYKKPHKWVYLMIILALATTLVSTDRTRFFYMVIWSFYVLVYLRRRVNLTPRVITAALATVLVLVGFFLLMAKLYVKQAYDDNMEYINLPPKYAAVIDPYIYLTGSFPVLQAFLEDKSERTNGKHTFESVVKLVELIHPTFHREVLVTKFYTVPIDLNVATYLQPFYQDWGWAGLLLGPFCTGFLSMWCYVAMRRHKTLFAVYFCGLMSFCITISIFVNHFIQIATWFFVAVGFLVHRFVMTSKPQPIEGLREGIYH